MDEEPCPALREHTDAGVVAAARSAVADRIAANLLPLLPASIAVVGADVAMGADALALLPEGGAVELSFLGLCFDDIRVAAVFVAAGAKLVSSHAQETGSLEGEKLRELTSGEAIPEAETCCSG